MNIYIENYFDYSMKGYPSNFIPVVISSWKTPYIKDIYYSELPELWPKSLHLKSTCADKKRCFNCGANIYKEYLEHLDFEVLLSHLYLIEQKYKRNKGINRENTNINLCLLLPSKYSCLKGILKDWFKKNGVILKEWNPKIRKIKSSENQNPNTCDKNSLFRG